MFAPYNLQNSTHIYAGATADCAENALTCKSLCLAYLERKASESFVFFLSHDKSQSFIWTQAHQKTALTQLKLRTFAFVGYKHLNVLIIEYVA